MVRQIRRRERRGHGQETLTLKGHAGGVVSVAFSSDGKRLASDSWDNTLKVWDARAPTHD
jgi:WD40 repeat protein